MKSNLFFSLFLFSLASISFQSCDSLYGEVEPYEKEAVLQMIYRNPDGNTPTISILQDKTSPAINISSGNIVSRFVPPRINIDLNNIRFKDDLGTYEVEEILTEEEREGNFVKTYENYMIENTAEGFSFVLAIDASSSLGGDLGYVKQFALNTIKNIKTARPSINIEFGVVSFSSSINILPLTSDTVAVGNFIRNIQLEPETRLYEGIYTAAQLLQNTTTKVKSIITFTDGRNNKWSSVDFATPNFTKSYLQQPTANGTKVSTFFIGWTDRGGVDETLLSEMTSSDGYVSFPRSVRDLGRAFNKTAQLVSSVYSLTYDRNNEPVTQDLNIRVRFRLRVF